MILDDTIITNLHGVNSLETCCIISSAERNIQITKNIDSRFSNTGNISTRSKIPIVPKKIASSVNFTNPDTVFSRIITLLSQSRSDIQFIKLVNCKTCIQERICIIAELINPININRVSANSRLTIRNVDCCRRLSICCFHGEVNFTIVDNNISNLFRITSRSKFSLNCKTTSRINQC